ncbi:MAG: hypothetical protein HYZ24_08830 [Chloroflexi bacterium]|nr:hypothetical protein [Chloroflexota bacterium]
MKTESSPKSAGEAKAYPPSFVDRLMAWIERLPGSAWVFYLLATLVIVALGHGLDWLDGTMEFGTFNTDELTNDSVTIYALAALHLLNATARRSLEDFRPALGKLEAQYEKLRYELTTLSPRFVTITTGIGLLLAILVIANSAGKWIITDDSSLVTNAFNVLQITLTIVSFTGLASQMIRQVRLIATIHRSATNVNLYESDSHHAFSRLTVRAALALAFPTYFFLFTYYWQDGRIVITSALDKSLFLFAILVSVAVFILPLLGMRRRLVEEKNRLMVESDRRFEAAARKLHQRVDADSLEKMDDLNKTMASLILEKDTLKKISTMPWEAETMRGFLSSVGLPILLWFVTTYFGRFFQ